MSPKIFGSKSSKKYECLTCDYITSRKSQYDRHVLTAKHLILINPKKELKILMQKVPEQFSCSCGKSYKHQSSLCAHKKKCGSKDDISNAIVETLQQPESVFTLLLNQNMELIKQNQEFKDLIIEQNNKMIEMAKEAKTINNTTTNNNTNNNFNLQFFLNEQCKDALNIMDFINQLQLNTSDLDMVGRVGYSEGISKLFIRGLKELDVFKRPIHCSDLKREVLYVKDKDAWEKDNDEKKKMKNAIKYIAAKNFKQIHKWQEENPESNHYDSKKNDDYNQIILNSMGGATAEEDESNYNKIIRNVAKESVIDKEGNSQ